MQRDVPLGGIVSWSGSIVNIPDRFVLCDGTNGTPDLRNKFIVGAGDTYAKGAAGGAVNHTHPFTGDGHTHILFGGADIQFPGGLDESMTTEPITGTTDNGSSLPTYYSLAYIMYKGV